MPVFRYKAVNASGGVAVGELEAANESEIVDRLRDQGLMPMQVARAAAGGGNGNGGGAAVGAAPGARRRWFASKSVSRDNLLAITRELATLLRAGLPLDRALEILISLADAPPVAALLQGIRDDVRGGKSLSQALDARREVFGALLRQHHPRGRGRRRARHRAVPPRGHDGAQQGAARERDFRAHLSDDPDLRRRAVADADPRLRRAAVRADVRAGRARAAAGHAGRDLPRHRRQAMVVGDRGALDPRGPLDAPPAARSRRARALGCADPPRCRSSATS